MMRTKTKIGIDDILIGLRPKKNRCVSADMPKKMGSVGRKIFLFKNF